MWISARHEEPLKGLNSKHPSELDGLKREEKSDPKTLKNFGQNIFRNCIKYLKYILLSMKLGWPKLIWIPGKEKSLCCPGQVAQLAGISFCTLKGCSLIPGQGTYREQLINVSLSPRPSLKKNFFVCLHRSFNIMHMFSFKIGNFTSFFWY